MDGQIDFLYCCVVHSFVLRMVSKSCVMLSYLYVSVNVNCID